LTGAAVDITDRKRLEEELREVDRGKNDFLAMLGHELRNPLAPLRGVMEVLQRQQLDGPQLERASAMMDRQVAHLVRQLGDLLDVSRITRGRGWAASAGKMRTHSRTQNRQGVTSIRRNPLCCLVGATGFEPATS
jgi:signal transduction histidine kinase